jgi:glucose/arabinose dehydrogenase
MFTMKMLIAAAVAAFAFAGFAQAAEMKFPSDEPVASITLPDGWTANETDTGMEVTTADGSIYLAVDVAEPKDTEQVAKDAIVWLGSQGVTVDPATQKESQDKLNGRDIFYLDWKGKDKEGDTSVGLAALVLTAETVLVLTYWGDPAAEQANGAAIVGVLKSIKPVE